MSSGSVGPCRPDRASVLVTDAPALRRRVRLASIIAAEIARSGSAT